MMKQTKKFILMGAVALFSTYGLQAAGVMAVNELNSATHEMHMVSLYNTIWTKIGQKSVDQEIKEYQFLDKNPPSRYEFGFSPKKNEKTLYLRPQNLPDGDHVREAARNLHKKTKIFN